MYRNEKFNIVIILYNNLRIEIDLRLRLAKVQKGRATNDKGVEKKKPTTKKKILFIVYSTYITLSYVGNKCCQVSLCHAIV